MAVYRIGTMIRETGQALERLGCRLVGVDAFQEDIYRHRSVMNLGPEKPKVSSTAWVAPSASVVGNVKIEDNASIWYGAVVKGPAMAHDSWMRSLTAGDESAVEIGAGSNVQDGATVGVALTDTSDMVATIVGKNVTIGHMATLSGCTVEDECLIGMGSVIRHGVRMERGSILAAGSVVAVDTRIPPNQLWAGNPAVYKRDLKSEETGFLPVSAQRYTELAQRHASITSAMQEKLDA